MTADNQLTDVLAQLVTKMGDAAEKYGPQAISLAGQYEQTKAIINICELPVGILTSYLLYRLTKFAWKNDWEEATFFPAFFFMVMTVWTFFSIIDADTYLSALSPNFALVHLVEENKK